MYKLTITGWIQSFRVCWKETIPTNRRSSDTTESSHDDFDDEHLFTVQNKDEIEDKEEESMTRPV